MGGYNSERLVLAALVVIAVGTGLVAYPDLERYFTAGGDALSWLGQIGVFILSCCAGLVYFALMISAVALVVGVGSLLIRLGSRTRAWITWPADKFDDGV